MFKIKEFSQQTNVTVRTLQYYDDIGLLTPKRNSSGHRLYTTKDLIKMNEILLMKQMGLALESIVEQLAVKEETCLKESLLRQEKFLEEQIKRRQEQLQKVRQLIATTTGHQELEDTAIQQAFLENNPFSYHMDNIWTLDFTKSENLQLLKNNEKIISFDAHFSKLAKRQHLGYQDTQVQTQIQHFVQELYDVYHDSMAENSLSEIAVVYRTNEQASQYLTQYGKEFPVFLANALDFYVGGGNT
ncbi:MerR family transcriptional regulator [Enterococcus saccharolyticus]|uniref:HTH merR-type domain-containing protein n=1 Tax=Candidatus Enterococcus willemsii TaxID=1857215 RepID=A0ABQ6YY74_9ENTE|nr:MULTISPECIES: MerR family transcriptional regulator [Enterococcus]KAF1302438.1 hypothetical protein BAU17_09290 [Enterococcus sp. CU12B]MCD5002620.1 MerR family transcriptional regulator [Enterococcus saccharolyticus]